MLSGKLPFNFANDTYQFLTSLKAGVAFDDAVWTTTSSEGRDLVAGLLEKKSAKTANGEAGSASFMVPEDHRAVQEVLARFEQDQASQKRSWFTNCDEHW
mmetsp:Transcript_28977/g.112716  ORF Transcript_28977/g.112716 Transcript_28977/m.112716 type:complete len:100 (-) Transcript_28977:1014-1313(-)